MKIAVASHNGTGISDHFGQSACFLIYEVENNEIIDRTVRENRFTGHARGQCGDSSAHPEGHHSHAGITSALEDCVGIVCRGMGMRAAADMKKAGIKTYILTQECTPEVAVNMIISGSLQESSYGFCCGRHHH